MPRSAALVANDVHGKNHHRAGSFGAHVQAARPAALHRGEIDLAPGEGGELFAATIGGLGLTGVITWVELAARADPQRLLDVETHRLRRISRASSGWPRRAATATSTRSPGSTASPRAARLGRGIFSARTGCDDGGLAPHSETAPCRAVRCAGRLAQLLSRSGRSTALYYRLQKSGTARQRMHYEPFFFPLDTVGHWNRLYGRRGFYQYQCRGAADRRAEAAIAELLRELARIGRGSVLAVLKTFGADALARHALVSAPGRDARARLPQQGREDAAPARPHGRRGPPSRRAALSGQGRPMSADDVPRWLSGLAHASRRTSIRASAPTSGGGAGDQAAGRKRVIVLGALSAIGRGDGAALRRATARG